MGYRNEREPPSQLQVDVLQAGATLRGLPEVLTLEDILANSTACAFFKKFAESEFCLEPLLFW